MPVGGNEMPVGENETSVSSFETCVGENKTSVARNGMYVGGIKTKNRRFQMIYLPCGIASRALRKAAPFCVCALAESVLVVLPFASVAESNE